MLFLLPRLLLAMSLLSPSVSMAQSFEERSAALIDARNSLHAGLDALPFRKFRLDFATLGSEAFAAEEVYIEALVDKELGYLSSVNNRFDIIQFYPDVGGLVETYLSTLIARYEPQTSPEKIVVVPPFDLPFENELEVTGVSFGDDILAAAPFWMEQDQPAKLTVRGGLLGLEVTNRDNRPLENPTTAFVRLVYDQPNWLQTYQFDELEPGSAVDADPYRVTLRLHESDYLEFSIERLDGKPVDRRSIRLDVEAVDVSGRGVRVAATNSSHVDAPRERWETLADLLDQHASGEINDEEAQIALASMRRTASEKLIVRTAFIAPVAGATLYISNVSEIQSVEHELSLPVIDFTQLEQTSSLVDTSPLGDTPLFAPEFAMINDGTPNSLSVDDVRNRLSVKAFSDAVLFQLPPSVSDLLFQNLWSSQIDIVAPITFLNSAGQVIDVEEPFQRPPTSPYPYFFSDVIGGDRIIVNLELFPERPARVVGTVVVNLLPEIQRTRYGINNLPNGVQVAGNKLIVGGFLRRNGVKVIALDISGKPLRQFFQTESGGPGVFGLTARHFYGTIGAIEVLIAGPAKEVEVDFDVDMQSANPQ